MISLNDITAANNLLVSLGGEDQMNRIAATAIDRSLELQHRVDRALKYAAEAPANSMHAKNIARILDGSITVDDELNEVSEQNLPTPKRLKAVSTGGQKKTKTTAVRGEGLRGRSTKERKAFREWLQEHNIDLPKYGPIDQSYVDAFDESVANRARGSVSA
jgi:hypothetical protein